MLEQKLTLVKQLNAILYLQKLGYAEEFAKLTEKLTERPSLICDVYIHYFLHNQYVSDK